MNTFRVICLIAAAALAVVPRINVNTAKVPAVTVAAPSAELQAAVANVDSLLKDNTQRNELASFYSAFEDVVARNKAIAVTGEQLRRYNTTASTLRFQDAFVKVPTLANEIDKVLAAAIDSSPGPINDRRDKVAAALHAVSWACASNKAAL